MKLISRLAEKGTAHRTGGGGDYFIYPLGLYDDMPPFAIGRGAWDNWFIYHAREMKIPVIDCTTAITAIHQNHDYLHVRERNADLWGGPESKVNIELMGGEDRLFATEYATTVLTPQGLKPARTPRHLYYKLRALPVLHPCFRFLLAPFKAFEALLRALR